MLRAELTQLKQFQTFQAQQFDEMIQRAKEQIVQRVAQTSSGKFVIFLLLFVGDFFSIVCSNNLFSSVGDDSGLKSRRQKVQAEEMTYVQGKNDINRHIR